MAYRRKNPWVDYVTPDLSHRHAPELVPIFGVKTFDATTTCEGIHPNGPIPGGSRCVCMACNHSGVDHFRSVREHRKREDGLYDAEDQWAPTTAIPTKYVPLAEIASTSPGKAPLRGGLGS